MLKYQVDDLATVDEPNRALYEREGDEGPFRLKLELPANHSVENVAGLKSALTKERANNKSLVQRVAELEGEGKNATHTLAGKVEQLSDQNSRLLAALNAERVRSTCNEAVAAAKGIPALLLPILTQRVAVESDTVVVKDERGNTLLNAEGLPITVAEFVSTMRGRDEYAGGFLGTGSSGGGSPPSSGNGGTVTASKPRSQMDVRAKAAFIREHGTEAYMNLPA